MAEDRQTERERESNLNNEGAEQKEEKGDYLEGGCLPRANCLPPPFRIQDGEARVKSIQEKRWAAAAAAAAADHLV